MAKIVDADKLVLDKFMSEQNRLIEESFARTFSEKSIKLFFTNEDLAYTDGKNVIVSPSFLDIYRDRDCVKKTEEVLGWQDLLYSPWSILKLVTRGLTIHECLHLIYTDFPEPYLCDPEIDSNNKKRVISAIFNVVEDAYIDAAGASEYDNITLYLMFVRVAQCFAHKHTESTAQQKMKLEVPPQLKDYVPPTETEQKKLTAKEQKQYEEYLKFKEAQEKMNLLIRFVDYMAGIIIFSIFDFPPPSQDIAEYVDKTKQLYLEGSVAPTPKKRYEYVKKIYHIISHLIPDDDVAKINKPLLDNRFPNGNEPESASTGFGGGKRQGEELVVTTRLFVNLDGSKKPIKKYPNGKGYTEKSEVNGNGIEVEYIYTSNKIIKQLIALINEFKNDEKNVDVIFFFQGFHIEYKASNFGAAPIHKNIKINENHPKVNLNMQKAYKNVYDKYRININSYNSKFLQLLAAQVTVRENNFLFGSGVCSKRLGDVKKHFWYRNLSGVDIPDLSVLLLIDGSGSMMGSRRNSAMTASVILHEILKKQNIEHAIVEHRAQFGAPEIDINVLVDFNAKEEEKYNIMMLKAEGENRDALALYWAERYINSKTYNDNKLIIVLSDGMPSHDYDDYSPPACVKDTANAAKKIMNRGTKIVAVALDDKCVDGEMSTYDYLKEIYPHLVQCTDLKRLTRQILGIVSKQLN